MTRIDALEALTVPPDRFGVCDRCHGGDVEVWEDFNSPGCFEYCQDCVEVFAGVRTQEVGRSLDVIRDALSFEPRFPDVEVALVGADGNAFSVVGRVTQALRRAGHGDAIAEFQAEAMSGDYDHLLQTVLQWVEVA